MPGRIVLFGATGYTGRLTAEALVARGARPVLAARSEARLRELAADLGAADLEQRTADVQRPDTVAALVERGDVLVSTVGPFTRWGDPAVQAAIGAGAHYLDSTGESPFIRRVFERFGGAAESAGCGLVTAFGYDWVPGNLAGALTLREAGSRTTLAAPSEASPDGERGPSERAVRVDIGYFVTGRAEMSGGTRASAIEALLAPSYGWRGGRLITERGAARMRHFDVEGRSRPAVSVGTSEAFALPRLHTDLREVNVYLGWFGPLARPLQAGSLVGSFVQRVPGVRPALRIAGERALGLAPAPEPGTTPGTRSWIAAEAYDGSGRQLTEIHLAGVDGYEFTASFIAWAAQKPVEGAGALGPVQAFGLERLEQGA
ncbi:MAG: saccharopine dehydrogenase family protein, partial [Solirubrobacterales bacterium]